MGLIRFALLASLLSLSSTALAEALGSAFTYQGELKQLGVPANGTYDFQFDLYNVATIGSPVAATVQVDDVVVADGVFTVNMDFGSSAYHGDKLWLEIAVRDGASEGGFTTMSPRQVITPTPFALQAQSVPDSSITAAQIDTTSVQKRVTGACAVGNVVRAINADGSVVCEPDADTTLSESEVDAFVANNGYSTGPHTVDTTCSLSACTEPGLPGFATLTCGATSVTVSCSNPGTFWVARTAAAASTWRSVTYGGGLFVAVAYGGASRVMTSPDGISWTPRDAAQANVWTSVTFGDGLFVAISLDGTNRVMTSPDGVAWTARTAAEANSWRSVTYGGGLFVAVAFDGTNRVMTSPDGINWTARVAAEANTWQSVTYSGGLFVAVAAAGTNRVMTSPDGINWSARAAAQANQWISVTFGSGLFVAVASSGTNRVMTSPDGITWMPRVAAEANTWQSVAYGNGLFVAVSNSGTNRAMTSLDGIYWISRSATEANSWFSVIYGVGLFVAVADDGTHQVMTTSVGG